MTKKHSFTWRKSIVFSATFLLIALVSVSCKKKENQIGSNTIDQNDLLASGGIDTFSLITYTLSEDSTSTKDNVTTLLGSYNDPTFGMVTAEIYSQLQPQSFPTDFGDLSTIVMDSFVLGLVYSGFYGKTGDQTIEVFEIDDVNGISNEDDSDYYQFSSVSSDELTNWVDPNFQVLNMNPENVTIIDSAEVPSQLRIHLDTNKAKTFMQDAASMPTSFETAEAFSEYFKGLHIRTSNGTQASGEGGVFYFDLKATNSKMTVYYKQDGQAKVYDFVINAETPHFNKVDMDNAMTPVQNVLDDTSLGQQEYYFQSFKNRAVLEIPGLSNISENTVLHGAALELAVSHQTGVEFEPPQTLSIARKNPDAANGDADEFIPVDIVSYSSLSKSYTFNLRFHIQRIIDGELENTPLYVITAPVQFNSLGNRIIFNGPETINKEKPSLRLLYTEF
ncbi:MAG: DUF4270 family protein [Crocinitomicaceae bacterium]